MRRVVIAARAEEELTAAAIWYQEQRQGLGEEFLVDVQSALERVAASPRQFTCVRRRPEVRRALTSRFPYRIFFVLRPRIIVVFSILHVARHDREWQKEIRGDLDA